MNPIGSYMDGMQALLSQDSLGDGSEPAFSATSRIRAT